MTTSQELDPRLLEILACPEDKGPLLYFPTEQILFNPRLKRTYAIREGIPVMLVDEASDISDAEAERLTKLAADSGITPTFEA